MRPDRWYLEAVRPDEAAITRKESTHRRQCELQRGVRDVVLPQMLVQPSTTAVAAAMRLMSSQAAYEYHLMDWTESKAVPVDDCVLWHMWSVSNGAVDDKIGRESMMQHPAAAAIFYVRSLHFPDAVRTLLRIGDPRFYQNGRRLDWDRLYKALKLSPTKTLEPVPATTAWSMGEADGGSDWVYRAEIERRGRLSGVVDEAYKLARLDASQAFWRFVLLWWRSVVYARPFDPRPYLTPEECEEFSEFSSKFHFSGQVAFG